MSRVPGLKKCPTCDKPTTKENLFVFKDARGACLSCLFREGEALMRKMGFYVSSPTGPIGVHPGPRVTSQKSTKTLESA